MNADRLLAQYHRIADAPDAIPRLRRFVLDLAVRGKLVPEDTTDEPVSVLLKRKKAPFYLEGAFDLPRTWAWVSVSAVATARLGKMLDKSKNIGTPRRYLRNINVRWFDFDLSDLLEMRFEDSELPEFGLRSGDVLICEGGEPGRAAVWDERESGIYFQKAIHRVRLSEVVDPHYFVKALRASADDGRLTAYYTGTGIKHFTGNSLDSYTFPLPPLAEQHRIVAKVDELMALCNRLEAARAEREAWRDRLAAASLARLNTPDPDPAAFADHARFTLNNLAALTTRPDQVKQLRQTILNLAARGRLSPPGAWPRETKALGSVAKLQNGYAFKSEWFARDGIRLLGNTNIDHGTVRWGDTACLPDTRAAEFERFRLNEGDVVLSLDRPFIVAGTKVARVRQHDLPCLLLQRVGRFQPDLHRLSAEFLFLWLHSPRFSDQIDPGRSNGVPHISSKQVEAAEIFVPPLAEQRRIVAKVDELMALCDRLEANLTTSGNTSRRLLDALLADALAPAEMREEAA